MTKPTLSPKRQRFVTEYMVDNNATQAAIRAGYAKSGARTEGARLLANADIRAAIDERTLAVAVQAEVSQEWVVTRLRDLALDSTKNSDRIRALELLGKHLGMFIERSVHLNAFVRPELQGKSIEELEAIEAALWPAARAS